MYANTLMCLYYVLTYCNYRESDALREWKMRLRSLRPTPKKYETDSQSDNADSNSDAHLTPREWRDKHNRLKPVPPRAPMPTMPEVSLVQ